MRFMVHAYCIVVVRIRLEISAGYILLYHFDYFIVTLC